MEIVNAASSASMEEAINAVLAIIINAVLVTNIKRTVASPRMMNDQTMNYVYRLYRHYQTMNFAVYASPLTKAVMREQLKVLIVYSVRWFEHIVYSVVREQLKEHIVLDLHLEQTADNDNVYYNHNDASAYPSFAY